MSKPCIILNQVSKKIDDTKLLFENVNITLEFGNFYLIRAKSGLGKTTLLTMIGNLEKPTHGTIEYHGIDVKEKPFSYLFTDHMNFKDFTGYENLGLVSKEKDKIDNIANELGIYEILSKKVSTYSKGEYARLAIARIILEDKPILLLDEPTGNLDEENTTRVFNILKKLSKEKLILCVTHDYFDDELINLTIDNQRLCYTNDTKKENFFDKPIHYKQKHFFPISFMGRFLCLLFKSLPVKYISFVLVTLFIFIITTMRASFINPEKQIETLLKDNAIEFVTINKNIDTGYYFYPLKVDNYEIPCLYSLNDEFKVNGNLYKLKNNSILLNQSYAAYGLDIPIQEYVDLNKYSLVSKDYIIKEFIEKGLTIDLDTIPLIKEELKKSYLDIFDFRIVFKEDSTLTNDEIILHCQEEYYMDIMSSLSKYKTCELFLDKSSPIYSISKSRRIVDILPDENIKDYTIEIEGSKEWILEIQEIFPLIYNQVYNKNSYISNEMYNSINLFEISTDNLYVSNEIYFLTQIHWLLQILDYGILFLYIIFGIFTVFLMSGIRKKFCNEFNLFRILGFNKINIIFLISIGFLLSIFIGYFLSGAIVYAMIPSLIDGINKLYSMEYTGYFILSFSTPYISCFIMVLIVIITSILFTKSSKNLNTVLKENKI